MGRKNIFFRQIVINNLHYLRKICSHNEVDPSSHKSMAENSIREDKEETGRAMMGKNAIECIWVYSKDRNNPTENRSK